MKQFINIHHTATQALDDTQKQFTSVNAGHKVRFGEGVKSKLGFYGGYHYLVERDGTIGQYRNDDEVGAHNNVSEMNFKAIGVCFAGNMSKQNLSDKQIKSGYELIKRLQEKHKIPDANVHGHKKYKQTQCPGNLLGNDPWGMIQKLYKPKDPEWFDRKFWEGLVDVDGYVADPNPYKTLEAIRKAVTRQHG